MAKIYSVEIRNITTGVMYVMAEDEENAREIAAELADAGEGEWHMDFGGGYAEAQYPAELTGKDALENTAEAEANREAYKGLIEEKDCNYVSEDSNVCITHNKEH